jgi:hypothetical protein
MMTSVMTIVGMSMKFFYVPSDDEDCDDEESNYNFGTKKEEGTVLLNESEEDTSLPRCTSRRRKRP